MIDHDILRQLHAWQRRLRLARAWRALQAAAFIAFATLTLTTLADRLFFIGLPHVQLALLATAAASLAAIAVFIATACPPAAAAYVVDRGIGSRNLVATAISLTTSDATAAAIHQRASAVLTGARPAAIVPLRWTGWGRWLPAPAAALLVSLLLPQWDVLGHGAAAAASEQEQASVSAGVSLLGERAAELSDAPAAAPARQELHQLQADLRGSGREDALRQLAAAADRQTARARRAALQAEARRQQAAGAETGSTDADAALAALQRALASPAANSAAAVSAASAAAAAAADAGAAAEAAVAEHLDRLAAAAAGARPNPAAKAPPRLEQALARLAADETAARGIQQALSTVLGNSPQQAQRAGSRTARQAALGDADKRQPTRDRTQATAAGAAKPNTAGGGKAAPPGKASGAARSAPAGASSTVASQTGAKGSGRQGAGSGRQGAGSGRQGAGSGRQGAGSGRQGAGSGRQGAGSSAAGGGQGTGGAPGEREVAVAFVPAPLRGGERAGGANRTTADAVRHAAPVGTAPETYQAQLQVAREQAAAAVSRQAIPQAYRAVVKGYFNRLDEGSAMPE
jgi:hypothetical protein